MIYQVKDPAMRATVIAAVVLFSGSIAIIAPRSEGGGHWSDGFVATASSNGNGGGSANSGGSSGGNSGGGSNSGGSSGGNSGGGSNSGGSSGSGNSGGSGSDQREQPRPFSGGRAARRSHRGSHDSLRRSSGSIGSLSTRSACRLRTTLFSSYHRKVKHRQVSPTAYSTRNRP